jgi:uncharacterized protein YggE
MKQVLMAIVAAAAMPLSALAQSPTPPNERTVVVTATESVEREPERAVVLLAVESTGQTAGAASAANATKMDAVLAALRRLGLSGRLVRTVSYQIVPQYAQPSRTNPEQEPKIVGYRAINMVQATVDTVARVGRVIDGAISAGANRVANLHFELKDPQAARTEALRLAVARARGEAQAMAEAAGERLGSVLNMTTGSYGIPRSYAPEMAMDMVRAQAAPPTPIEAGMLTIVANVTITFRLEGR